jgi:anti-sigma regulatory factor (Ser/Thr protein kinase)
MERLHQFSQTITLSDVAPIRQQLEKVMIASGADPEVVGDIILALNEAIINSIRHGYQGQSGWLHIEVWRNGRSLVVKQSDKAAPFDPTTVPPPDTTIPLALRSPGGMGVQMMRSFTDELAYARTADGRNLLTLIKYDAFAK